MSTTRQQQQMYMVLDGLCWHQCIYHLRSPNHHASIMNVTCADPYMWCHVPHQRASRGSCHGHAGVSNPHDSEALIDSQMVWQQKSTTTEPHGQLLLVPCRHGAD